MFSNDRLIELTFHFFCFFNHYWFLKLQFNRYNLLLFLLFIICRLLFFGVLVIIFASFIVDLFVRIYWIRVHWSWNLSLGVLANFLWAVSKPDMRIFFPCKFTEGYGEGAGWVFRLVCFNWLLCLIYNLIQFLRSSLLLLIVDFCVSYLLDQISLILKLVLGCVRKFSVGRIQTGHNNLLPPQIFGRLCWGCRFFHFIYPHQCIDWLQGSSKSYSSFKLFR